MIGENKMSNGAKRIGIYGAAGILVAIIIIAGFLIGNTYFQDSDKGTLTILITDKPVELKYLNITIDWVRIHDQDGNWHYLVLKTAPEPFYFDLLALRDVSTTLSETEIPAGDYTMIWMHILKANATYPDDTCVDLRVPSDTIKVFLNPHLKVESGGQVTVLIDLQPDDLSSIAISQSLNLRPVVKAVVSQS